MKTHFIVRNLCLIALFLMGIIKVNAQIVPQKYGYNFNASKNLAYQNSSRRILNYLEDVNATLIEDVLFSKSSSTNLDSLSKLKTEFKRYFKFDYSKNRVLTLEDKIISAEIDSSSIEFTYYEFNLKTKKINYHCQIVIIFETPSISDKNPLVAQIILKTKNQIIKRENLIRKKEHKNNLWNLTEEAPQMEELK